MSALLNTFKYPIGWAIFVFPILSLVLILPYIVYQYRKYGSVLAIKTMILFSFVFYLLCSYFLVILPLPDINNTNIYLDNPINLKLFARIPETASLITLLDISDPSTYLPALLYSGLYEPICNIVMFIPFGVYLHYYFKKGFIVSVLISFCLSLFFELTQLSGLYGIYPRAYRLFDVTDLMDNSIGGMLGYILTPLVVFFLPSKEALNEEAYNRGEKVSVIRRFIAVSIDIFVTDVGILLLIYVMPYFRLQKFIITWLVIIIYFCIFPFIFKGRTLGKSMVGIKITDASTGGPAGFAQCFVRGFLLHGIYLHVFQMNLYIRDYLDRPGFESLFLGAFVIAAVMTILFMMKGFIWSLLSKDQMGYEKITNTIQVSTVHRFI